MFDLNEYIKTQLEEVDVKDVVRAEVRFRMSEEIVRQLRQAVKDAIDNLIESEIGLVLSKPIDTDDGWHKKEHYDSFEELFKKEFMKRLDNSWEMKKTIQGVIEKKVNNLYQENKNKIADKLADEIVNL